MTVLTPNEKLMGTPQQKREIYERLVRFHQHPDRTLKLSETHPTLSFQTLDTVLPGFGDREVFALGVRLSRERLAELGLSELLPHERVFVGVASTQPAWGGLGNTGIHRNQHGINFRRENGSSYSARDPRGSASTRNLGIIMEGEFDREAVAVVRDVAATAGIPCPTAEVDHYSWRDSTGDALHAPESADPWLIARNSYAASVTAPYAAFLAEIGGPEADELHDLLIRVTLEGNLYLTVPDYPTSYTDAPIETEALLVPEGTISVTRWLGRQLAENPEVSFPIKLFYDMPCFRNEVVSGLTGLKRRQFTQFGLEVLGAQPGHSDIESIYLISAGLEALGVPARSTRIRIGDVGVFNRLVELGGIGEDAAIGLKEALDALAECKAGKQPERAPALAEQMRRVLDETAVEPRLRATWLGLAQEPDSLAVVSALQDDLIGGRLEHVIALVDVLRELDVSAEIDLSVVRSHEYYTGIAFEIDVVAGDRVFVEVGGGGRYDKLAKHFIPNGTIDSVPATGFAFGVERLVELLDYLDLLTPQHESVATIGLHESPAHVLLVPSPTADGYLSAARVAAQTGPQATLWMSIWVSLTSGLPTPRRGESDESARC